MRKNSNIYSASAYVDTDSIDLEETSVSQQKDINLEFKYKQLKSTKHLYHSSLKLQHLANLPVKLVPIQLDLEIEGVKIRDSFTWNLNETLLSPELFAQILADDFDSPIAAQFIPDIADQIRKQVAEFAVAVEEDPTGDGQSRIVDEEGVEYQDLRLDLHMGPLCLTDQFEWPLFSTHCYLPEDFAKQLTCELGIASEFIPMISHTIREQVCQARLNFDEAVQPPKWKARPFRPESILDSWGPEVRILTEDEIGKIFKEKERITRRMRRQRQTERSRYSVPNFSTPAYVPPSSQPNLSHQSTNFMSQYSPFSEGGFVPITASADFQYKGNPKKIAYKNYQAKDEDIRILQDYVYKYAPPNDDGSPFKSPGKKIEPAIVDTVLLEKQIGQMKNSEIIEEDEGSNSPVREGSKSPIKKHRGFGASAQMFNADGAIDVGEFRNKWRCSWCLLSGRYTPTLRKGPLGAKTVCNGCGIWYGKHGTLPQSRFHEHRDSTS